MIGLYGPGMHDFVLDELELGDRTATYLDWENNVGWTAAHDLSYLAWVHRDRVRRGLERA